MIFSSLTATFSAHRANTQCKNLIQAGIRSLRHSEMIEDSIVQGNDVVTMTQFHEMGPEGLAALVPKGARPTSASTSTCWISPHTGLCSAEPNGMKYSELRDT